MLRLMKKRQMILILRYMVQSRKQRKQKLPTRTGLMNLKMQIYLIMNQMMRILMKVCYLNMTRLDMRTMIMMMSL